MTTTCPNCGNDNQCRILVINNTEESHAFCCNCNKPFNSNIEESTPAIIDGYSEYFHMD